MDGKKFVFDIQRFENDSITLTQNMFDTATETSEHVKKMDTPVGTFYQLDAGSYQLDDDITISDFIMISADVTLDLNERTLDVGSSAIVINNGSLTVEDNDPERKGTISGNPSVTGLIVVNTRTFTLNGGNIEITSTQPAVQVNGTSSTVNISGGKITAQNIGINVKSRNSSTVNITGGEIYVSGTIDTVFAVKSNSSNGNSNDNTINISDGTIISNGPYAVATKGSVNVSGGTITSASKNNFNVLDGTKISEKFTVTGGTFSGDVSECISAGVESVFVDDKLYVGNDYEEIKDTLSTYTLVEVDGKKKYYSDSSAAVVSVTLTKSDGSTSGYSTLAEAIAAADAGSTITLNKEINLTAQITLDKKITLDLNGQTLSSSTVILDISSGGELTLKDDSEGNTGKLSTSVNGSGIAVKSGGKFTIESGTIVNTNRVAISNSGTLTINGGTIESNAASNTNWAGIDNSGTLTINNGTVKSTGVHGISNSGTLTINGGTIEGNQNGINSRGTLTINNGTIGTTSSSKSAVEISKGSVAIKGGTIKSLSISGNDTSAEISGGTFTGAISSTTVKNFITGGVFSSNPSTDYLAEGRSVAQIGENYVVGSQTWYLKNSTGEWTNVEAIADPLAIMTVSDKTLTLRNKSGASGTVPLDVGKAVANNSEFTTLDASAATTALNITGDNVIASIAGGSANDTLTAGSSGVSLDGNDGNDLLIGGDGKDYFFYSGGSDSIGNYDSASDVVSLKSGTAPTTFDNVKYNGSDYIISLGSGANESLTFKSTAKISLVKDGETFYYAHDRIIFDDKAITLGAAYDSKTLNVNRIDGYEGIASINAAAVTVNGGLTITGNEDKANKIIGATSGGKLIGKDNNDTLKTSGGNTTLDGGDGSDSLIGGAGKDLFVYTGGADSISGYDTGDLVSVKTSQDVSFKDSTVTSDDDNVTLNFGGDNKLVFVDSDKAISVQSGRNLYTLTKQSVALDKSVTLTANFTADLFSEGDAYNTIDAAVVGKAISIVGNDNGNVIIGSASYANSLAGGKGNDTFTGGDDDDTLVGGEGADIFRYTTGKDVVQNFDASDKLLINADAITETKAGGNRKLTFTIDKNNSLTFKADDSIPASILLESGGYLTKDGVVGENSLTLFTSARGTIDLTDELYSGANISLVSAEKVAKQSVTLVGSSIGGAFSFAANKKRDVFEYNGGAVSISGYESGKDRINLGDYAISAFSVNSGDVLLTLTGDDENIISLKGAKGSEMLIHQSTNRGNSYSKMSFAETGVLYDKAATKATSATLETNAPSYTAGNSIKKVTVGNVAGISIAANDKLNTVIDASKAGAVSLISGAKNDKFTGSAYADTFVYTGGKDIFQGFDEADSISLSNNLNTAKITAGKKSVKFKFGSKDVLTIKPTKNATLSGELNINETTYTYGKNSIADGSRVSLTSEFGGTYKVAGDVNNVDGHLVKKKLTIKGTAAAESLIGGQNKTTFKGGGGNDTLRGGTGADTFFYARGDKDSVTIANFDFNNDKLKIASGTLAKVSSIEGGVQFGMKEGKGTDAPEVGWFNVTTAAKNVLIKTNNTYYWFADGTEILADDDTLTADKGALITSVNKINKSQVSGYSVIDLNYSTNLIKSEVAVQVKDTLKAAT